MNQQKDVKYETYPTAILPWTFEVNSKTNVVIMFK
jgi:hypothetical protein